MAGTAILACIFFLNIYIFFQSGTAEVKREGRGRKAPRVWRDSQKDLGAGTAGGDGGEGSQVRALRVPR